MAREGRGRERGLLVVRVLCLCSSLRTTRNEERYKGKEVQHIDVAVAVQVGWAGGIDIEHILPPLSSSEDAPTATTPLSMAMDQPKKSVDAPSLGRSLAI